jgi:hypothetical protein
VVGGRQREEEDDAPVTRFGYHVTGRALAGPYLKASDHFEQMLTSSNTGSI